MELDHGSKQNTSNQRGSHSLLQRHDGPVSLVAVLAVNDHHYTNIPKIVIEALTASPGDALSHAFYLC